MVKPDPAAPALGLDVQSRRRVRKSGRYIGIVGWHIRIARRCVRIARRQIGETGGPVSQSEGAIRVIPRASSRLIRPGLKRSFELIGSAGVEGLSRGHDRLSGWHWFAWGQDWLCWRPRLNRRHRLSRWGRLRRRGWLHRRGWSFGLAGRGLGRARFRGRHRGWGLVGSLSRNNHNEHQAQDCSRHQRPHIFTFHNFILWWLVTAAKSCRRVTAVPKLQPGVRLCDGV